MGRITVKIKEEYIKLDSLLKLAGLVSTGGEAKIVIKENMVFLNDEVCTQRGKKIRKGDSVIYNGTKIEITNEDK